MKTAVVSANIGGIDEIFPLVKQSVDYDFFYWCDSTLPFPLPNLDQRMKGKYLKTQTHRFLDHDIIIWIDASIEVINPDFVKDCNWLLKNTLTTYDEFNVEYTNQIVIEKHAQRKNAYKELEYIIEKMKSGDRYLLKRYAKQPLYLEYEFYREKGLPKDYPLYQCSFFARWNDEKTNKIFDDWWDHILKFSNFDQTQNSYVLWKNDAKVSVIDTKDYFIRNKHINYRED